jgi:hypothetical protein
VKSGTGVVRLGLGREWTDSALSVVHTSIRATVYRQDTTANYHLTAVTIEANKKKRTEEDSVSCPMKYSTDVACRSDSLAVISYRDINQFTYVNLSYRQNKLYRPSREMN